MDQLILKTVKSFEKDLVEQNNTETFQKNLNEYLVKYNLFDETHMPACGCGCQFKKSLNSLFESYCSTFKYIHSKNDDSEKLLIIRLYDEFNVFTEKNIIYLFYYSIISYELNVMEKLFQYISHNEKLTQELINYKYIDEYDGVFIGNISHFLTSLNKQDAIKWCEKFKNIGVNVDEQGWYDTESDLFVGIPSIDIYKLT